MNRRFVVLAAALAAGLPLVSAPLTAQAVIFGEEPKLDAMRLALKADVLVLRDTLAMVDATSARLVRAKIGNSPSVVTSSARALRVDCARATRAIGVMQKQMMSVGTNDPRGKGVINEYNAGLVVLARSMVQCDKSLGTSLAAPKRSDNDPMFRAALASTEALKQYDVKLHVLLKTLQIPVDPKGFKSALKLQ